MNILALLVILIIYIAIVYAVGMVLYVYGKAIFKVFSNYKKQNSNDTTT